MNVRRTRSGSVAILLLALGAALTPTPAAEDAAESGPEQRFLGRIRQLTFEGRRAGEGYFSPDGQKLVFQSEREPGNPFFQIYELDFRTGDTRRVSPGWGKTTCSFFRPGSDEILYSSTHHDPASRDAQRAELETRAKGAERRYGWDFDPEMEIYVARPAVADPVPADERTGIRCRGQLLPRRRVDRLCVESRSLREKARGGRSSAASPPIRRTSSIST